MRVVKYRAFLRVYFYFLEVLSLSLGNTRDIIRIWGATASGGAFSERVIQRKGREAQF